MSQKNSLFRNLMKGSVAGILATVPMTLFMLAAWKLLPRREKYPLPPRQITNRLVQEVEPPVRMQSEDLTALALVLHFLFGAFTGALYSAVEEQVPLGDHAKGQLMGMAVWSGSYLGWIPLLGILPPATEHPWRRNVLMIVAHLIWGLALGRFTRMLKGGQRQRTIPQQ